MLTLARSTRVFVVAGATDMRRSFNGLAAIVMGQLELDLLSGHLFVFANRRKNRLKVLYFDGSGLYARSVWRRAPSSGLSPARSTSR